jgi:peptidoglycan/LPS O-acetylase OafA/YrhL
MTPNTSAYMIAGYIVFFVVSGLYLLSLIIRQRNLRRELDLLDELKREQNS